MSGNNRVPRFELHIRPLMRLLDRENMLRVGLDLWSYEAVKAEANGILEHLKADMPPKPYGGLWPREWVDLFDRWTKTGCRCLEIGKANVPWEVTRTGDRVEILGQSGLPDEMYESWLDPVWTSESARVYTLYWQDPDDPVAPPLTPREVVFEETFTAGPAEASVFIVDADGKHRFDIGKGENDEA